jgi:hypothetical protein
MEYPGSRNFPREFPDPFFLLLVLLFWKCRKVSSERVPAVSVIRPRETDELRLKGEGADFQVTR